MAVKVRYKQGTKQQYLALPERLSNALYWCTDTRELFKGDQLYSDGVRLIASYDALPAFDVAAEGILYVCEDTGAGFVLNSTRDGWLPVVVAPDEETIERNADGLLAVKAVPLQSVTGLEDKLQEIEQKIVAGGVSFSDEFEAAEDGKIHLKAVEIAKVSGLEERLTNIEQSAVGGVHYRGSVATVDALPSDAKQGDLYEVVADNSEWCWNGEKWFEYGKTTSLSPVATATLNPEQFAIKDNVINLMQVDSQLVSHRGKDLRTVVDELEQALVWEDMGPTLDPANSNVAESLSAVADGAVVHVQSGTIAEAVNVNKSVTLKGTAAGLAQNFKQEV